MSPSLPRLIGFWLLVAVPVAGAAPVPKSVPKSNAELLVGTWKLTKSSVGENRTSLSVEFAKDGTLTIRQSPAGENTEPTVYTGTYKVEADRIPYSVMTDSGEKSETLTIKKLTDDELIVVDPDDIREEFQRDRRARVLTK
jgi:uncharacterized protein (TIGR03066 family)